MLLDLITADSLIPDDPHTHEGNHMDLGNHIQGGIEGVKPGFAL